MKVKKDGFDGERMQEEDYNFSMVKFFFFFLKKNIGGTETLKLRLAIRKQSGMKVMALLFLEKQSQGPVNASCKRNYLQLFLRNLTGKTISVGGAGAGGVENNKGGPKLVLGGGGGGGAPRGQGNTNKALMLVYSRKQLISPCKGERCQDDNPELPCLYDECYCNTENKCFFKDETTCGLTCNYDTPDHLCPDSCPCDDAGICSF